MIKITSLVLFSLMSLTLRSQVVAGFEEFNLKPGEYDNDASPLRGFESGSVMLPNEYNPEFNFWSGFAISADTNRSTPGFTNQYSAYPGRGAEGSQAYAMGYIYEPIIIRLEEKAIGKPMIGMYVANSTYSFLSMRDGDGFAKKFGGETGDDPDFFLLTVKKYSGGVISDDSINVYLADYRSPNPTKDYILDQWKYIDLSILGEVDSLVLSLTSSDVGIFGMNTPSYVAIDQISTDNLLAAFALNGSHSDIRISPNPASENLYISTPDKKYFALTSITGAVHWSAELDAGEHTIRLGELPKGIFVVTADGRVVNKVCIE